MKKEKKSAKILADKLKEKELTLALAESCTGGLVSSIIAEVPGASNVLWGSFVCYTHQAKVSMLDIDNSLLQKYGLVSMETAKAMATGALKKSGASISAACTGIAGPDSDGSSTPVGTVWIAVARNNGEITAKEFHFEGSRNEIRIKTATAVLEIIDTYL